MSLMVTEAFFLCWAQWLMPNNDLGLLTGFRSVDLEKNGGIKCFSAWLFAISRQEALWCEPQELVNVL